MAMTKRGTVGGVPASARKSYTKRGLPSVAPSNRSRAGNRRGSGTRTSPGPGGLPQADGGKRSR